MTRTAQEIAAGLAPARPGRPIAPGTRIHVLGVGGAATAGAALHAHAAGAIVTGCDAGGPDPVNAAVVAAFRARGIEMPVPALRSVPAPPN